MSYLRHKSFMDALLPSSAWGRVAVSRASHGELGSLCSPMPPSQLFRACTHAGRTSSGSCLGQPTRSHPHTPSFRPLPPSPPLPSPPRPTHFSPPHPIPHRLSPVGHIPSHPPPTCRLSASPGTSGPTATMHQPHILLLAELDHLLRRRRERKDGVWTECAVVSVPCEEHKASFLAPRPPPLGGLVRTFHLRLYAWSR